MQASGQYGIDPWVLAGIGFVESDHGRSTAPGVRLGVNSYGCCAGPMQFSVVGSPSTSDRYGVDGNGDGRRNVYDPADAIPAAARYLVASGAPGDYRRALFAYNHAGWYVDEVLAKAAEYRAAAALRPAGHPFGPTVPPESVTVPEVLHNPRIVLTPDPALGRALRSPRPARAGDDGRHRPPPFDRDHGPEDRPPDLHGRRHGVQPFRRPGDGHRRGRWGDLPRYAHGPLRDAGAPVWPRSPVRCAQQS
jgi:Transglycosylase SLT domain